MTMPTRDHRRFGDDEIVDIVRAVEPHDFDRIAAPPVIWNNILAEVEVEVASLEATARRQSHRWFSTTRLLSAAAAALLMVGVTVAVVARGGDDSVKEIAAAMLTDDGLPVATTESAGAVVVCDGDDCFVDLELTGLPDAGDGLLELWVINDDVTAMHSLGNLTSDVGRFALPAGVTAEDFPIVDISIEPDDGDTAHSGQSVLRGVFDDRT